MLGAVIPGQGLRQGLGCGFDPAIPPLSQHRRVALPFQNLELFFILGNNGEPAAQAAKKGSNLPNEVILRPAVKPALRAITELGETSDPMLSDGLN